MHPAGAGRAGRHPPGIGLRQPDPSSGRDGSTAPDHHPGEPARADQRLVSALTTKTKPPKDARVPAWTMDLRSRTPGRGAAPAGWAFAPRIEFRVTDRGKGSSTTVA